MQEISCFYSAGDPASAGDWDDQKDQNQTEFAKTPGIGELLGKQDSGHRAERRKEKD